VRSKSIAPEIAGVLDAIPYPPVAEIITGYTPTAGMHSLDGFGCLIPTAVYLPPVTYWIFFSVVLAMDFSRLYI
jgi:hypothetical protein